MPPTMTQFDHMILWWLILNRVSIETIIVEKKIGKFKCGYKKNRTIFPFIPSFVILAHDCKWPKFTDFADNISLLCIYPDRFQGGGHFSQVHPLCIE